MISIRLKSGGVISLRCNVDPVNLHGRDRDLVLAVADMMREYAAAHPEAQTGICTRCGHSAEQHWAQRGKCRRCVCQKYMPAVAVPPPEVPA